MNFSAYVVPVIFILVLVASLIKRKNAYSYYIDGARGAVELMIGVFPFLLAIMVAVEVYRVSGVSSVVAKFVSPIFSAMGLPGELSELILLRPLSGAGSIAILNDVYTAYGVDTYIGRCASVIYGSSETVFYISAIYSSGCKLKHLGYAIPVSLIATLIGCIIGCLLLRIM